MPLHRILCLIGLLLFTCTGQSRASDYVETLRAENAYPELIAWAQTNQIKSDVEAWAGLERSDHMLWLLTKHGGPVDGSKMRLFAYDCAEPVLELFDNQFPGDKRPRKALETVKRFANSNATASELAAAAAEAEKSLSNAKYAIRNASDFRLNYAATCAWDACAAAYTAADPRAAHSGNPPADAPDPDAADASYAYTVTVHAVNAFAHGVAAISSDPDNSKATRTVINDAAAQVRSYQANRLRFYFPAPFNPAHTVRRTTPNEFAVAHERFGRSLAKAGRATVSFGGAADALPAKAAEDPKKLAAAKHKQDAIRIVPELERQLKDLDGQKQSPAINVMLDIVVPGLPQAARQRYYHGLIWTALAGAGVGAIVFYKMQEQQGNKDYYNNTNYITVVYAGTGLVWAGSVVDSLFSTASFNRSLEEKKTPIKNKLDGWKLWLGSNTDGPQVALGVKREF